MSKFKKIAVCCTSIIIVISLSLCFCFSASAASNMTVANISKSDVGKLPSDYDFSNFKIYNATWYHLNGNKIGGSSVNKVANGKFQFKDTHSAYRGDLEFRIQIEVPTEYLNKPFNFYFQFYNATQDSFAYIDLTHNSTVKYSYGHSEQELFNLSYFDFFPDDSNANWYWGYVADNQGIILKRNIISFSFYMSLDNTTSANTCFEFLIGGVQNSADNPSSPAYEPSDKTPVDEYNEAEDKLIDITKSKFLESFFNVIADIKAIQFFENTGDTFQAISACFSDFLFNIPYLRGLVYVALSLGVLSVFLGLAVRNSHRW